MTELAKRDDPRLVPGRRVRYIKYLKGSIWVIDRVVDRGIILYYAEDESHKHLCEWNELVELEIL